MCDKYNGWPNYQTWVFNLWTDGSFDEEADRIYHANDTDFDAIRALETLIKEFAEEFSPTSDTSDVWTDLMGHAIQMIDFFEIAEHYIDEIISYNEFDIREKVF